MKTEKEDILKQSNKSHKTLRDKIKKRRKNEKNVKKLKKEKKKKAEKKKHKKEQKKKKHDSGSDSDDSQPKGNKLDKYIKKLREIMGEEADDLFEMFELLDQKGEVVIEELENAKVKTYLKKIFKYMGLKYNSETKEYTKPDDVREVLKKKFQELWYKFLENDSSDSDKGKKSVEEEKSEDGDSDDEDKEVDISNTKRILLEEDKQKEKPKDSEKEEWKGFLDDTFGGLMGDKKDGYKKIGNLDKKGAGQTGTSTDKARDEAIDDFMKQYNSQFRKKTLMEEHQDRKKGITPTDKPERRAFDRNIDLGRTDSKKIFQMLNNKDICLTSRFQNSDAKKYL